MRKHQRLRWIAATSAWLSVSTLVLVPSIRTWASEEEAQRDLLHSDLPFFGRGEDAWPQHFSDDESFGCTSRVAFGDWLLREQRADGDPEESWYRFRNYGVFHCWANTYRATTREDLDLADAKPTFFVFLGDARVADMEIELWAVQIGTVPGSEYLLLSREPTEGVVEKFNVLQIACPSANVRDAGVLDLLSTRYCKVNTRGELIRLARRMAHRPPIGTLTRMPGDEADQS